LNQGNASQIHHELSQETPNHLPPLKLPENPRAQKLPVRYPG
jgi:hypothetical protein